MKWTNLSLKSAVKKQTAGTPRWSNWVRTSSRWRRWGAEEVVRAWVQACPAPMLRWGRSSWPRPSPCFLFRHCYPRSGEKWSQDLQVDCLEEGFWESSFRMLCWLFAASRRQAELLQGSGQREVCCHEYVSGFLPEVRSEQRRLRGMLLFSL